VGSSGREPQTTAGLSTMTFFGYFGDFSKTLASLDN